MVNVHEFDRMQEKASSILSLAKKHGADQAEVIVSSTENIATRYGEGHITQNTMRNSLSFNLRTQIGSQVGIYGGTAANQDKLDQMIQDALMLVRYSAPDPEFPGFVEEQPRYIDLDRSIIEYSPDDISAAIKSVIDSAEQADTKIAAVAGSINYIANRTLMLNTFDVEARTEGSTISGIVNVAARIGENESRSSDSIAGLTLQDLEINDVGARVAENAVRGLDQKELDVGAYPSILGHSALMELMFHIGMATSSSMLINHQSPFKDKMGEQVFDKQISITDATADPTHFSSQKFDTDGEPSPDVRYIDQGIVKEYSYNRRNAKKLGVETNGKSVGGFAFFRAPSFDAGNKSEEELIASIDNGVYVNNLWYSNFVNMPEASITGLTKDGLFKIENGEIVGSLKNMRFTDTLFSIFKDAEPANNLKMKLHSTYGNLIGLAGKLPSIKVNSFNFSSKGKH
ncbi:MAG: TldD/PmbA family protein [Candidatus Heimdallarchaeota archaeon]|nr:TldD/PmbA family protein [Candidatus Heimdallarchaeota archaeon]